MDQLLSLLPLLLCVGLHFFMMKGHNHGEMFNQKTESSRDTYTCPMHPEVKETKPGSCPKCGMTLVKKS